MRIEGNVHRHERGAGTKKAASYRCLGSTKSGDVVDDLLHR